MVSEQYLLFQPEFNRSIQVEVRDERLTSDAGALLCREAAERLGLFARLASQLKDPRDPEAVTHPLTELLRTLVLLQVQGWRDQDDVDRLRADPAFRLAVSDRRGDRPLREEDGAPQALASQPTLSRTLRTLSAPDNRSVLRQELVGLAVERLRSEGALDRPMWLDGDSLPLRVHGHQDQAEYNGHYRKMCYHPFVVTLGDPGDLLGVWLRRGAVHTAAGALDYLLETVRRFKELGGKVAGVRLDAGMPSQPLLVGLEDAEVPYVARLRRNAVLDRLAGDGHRLPHLPAPEGEAVTRFTEFRYAAASWSRKRRIIGVAIQEPGELFARSFYLVTSLEDLPPEELLALYRRRGNAENNFGEWMTSMDPHLSSARRTKSHYQGQAPDPEKQSPPIEPFAVNEAWLLVSALAYNLLHIVRTRVETATNRGWTLQSVREKVLKVGARVLLGGRRVTVVVAESARHLWAVLWTQISALDPVQTE